MASYCGVEALGMMLGKVSYILLSTFPEKSDDTLSILVWAIFIACNSFRLLITFGSKDPPEIDRYRLKTCQTTFSVDHK
jgi:hypothetical protein